MLETRTTAAVFIKWNGIIPEMMIPLDYKNFEIRPILGGGYALEFTDFEGEQRQINIEDVVFLRKFFTNRDVRRRWERSDL